MKKTICMLLIFVLSMSLFACSGQPEQTEPSQTEAPAESWLQAGFARVDITPDYSAGLAGSGNSGTRRSEEVLDPISITCVALGDGEQTILVFTVDTLGINMSLASDLRSAVRKATKTHPGRIFFGATHTHSAPDPLYDDEPGRNYRQLLCDAAADAAAKAIADLAPAVMEAGTKEIPGMNFVRHYKMSDGSYAGPNFGTFEGLEITGYSGTVDPELSLVKLAREGDKADILMLNWQAHPNRSSELGYYKISADFVGALRDKLEADTGMQVAYFTGASGNVHIDSQIEADSHGMNWKEYGQKLADCAKDALSVLKPVEGTGISTATLTYNAPIDHSWDGQLSQANEVYALWQKDGKPAGDALGLTYGFTSVYQARSIIERSKLPETIPWEMFAFRVGGVGFTTGVYEMFAEAGKYVKDNSPFETTFVITGNLIYVPTAEAYDYRCYEADTGYFARGTSEALAEEYVGLLKKLTVDN